MNPPNQKPSDSAPLTVAHGRKLYDLSKGNAELLQQLLPLLELLDPKEIDPEQDPLAQIISLLEGIAARQAETLAIVRSIDHKLDLIGGASNGAAR